LEETIIFCFFPKAEKLLLLLAKTLLFWSNTLNFSKSTFLMPPRSLAKQALSGRLDIRIVKFQNRGKKISSKNGI